MENSIVLMAQMNSPADKSRTTVKLGIKELFDKEQIGIKEPFPATDLPFTS